jgi:ArsR family transcriptional regulator
METKIAAIGLAALAHEGRLGVFRLLIQAEPEGLAAGEIARRMGMLPNTLSANLNVLSHAGLVHSRRDGRSIIYTAGFGHMRDLLSFLLEDCCGGSPEVCARLTEVVMQAACCQAGGAKPEGKSQ